MYKKDNVVYNKSFAFALSCITLYKNLTDEKEYIISKQLLRSGTSIGANIREGQYAESTKDFIHKMNISLKEAKETEYRLLLLQESHLTQHDIQPYLEQIHELIALLISIIKTMKLKIKNS